MDLAELARRLNVARVVLIDPDGDGIAVRIVYADERGLLPAPEILARPDVDLDFALAHVDAASIVSRFGATVTAADEMDAEVEKHRAILDHFRSAATAAAARGDDQTAAKMHDLAMHIEGELMWWEAARAHGELKAPRGYIDAHDSRSAHAYRGKPDHDGIHAARTLGCGVGKVS
jgi:hypothetical protein